MNRFCNQMFNPAYVNPNYYQSIQAQAMWQYEQNQNAEVQKAVKATHDLMEAVRNLDSKHQEEAFYKCLGIIAVEVGWDCAK